MFFDAVHACRNIQQVLRCLRRFVLQQKIHHDPDSINDVFFVQPDKFRRLRAEIIRKPLQTHLHTLFMLDQGIQTIDRKSIGLFAVGYAFEPRGGNVIALQTVDKVFF